MGLNLAFLVGGILLLYFGSEWLVRGASNLALAFYIRPAVIGLTVVAVATSAPELLVSVVAAAGGSSGVSVGNIIGSNVLNIALVLGLSALARPVSLNRKIVIRELPYMAAVSLIFWILCSDGRISRADGGILFLLLIVFLIYSIMTAIEYPGNSVNPKKIPRNYAFNALLILAGLVALALGADRVVKASVYVARSFHLSELFIGISIVAIGTSLPELATSVVAAVKKESDISVGNIVGSNLFNICLVMGLVGLISPISIDTSLNYFEFPAMMAVTLLLCGFCVRNDKLNRVHGVIFLISFVAYLSIAYTLSH